MSIHSITEDQFYLASRMHIPISESNQMADFEREAFINLIVRDIKNSTENEKMKYS